jgi:serine/threonine protein kinase
MSESIAESKSVSSARLSAESLRNSPMPEWDEQTKLQSGSYGTVYLVRKGTQTFVLKTIKLINRQLPLFMNEMRALKILGRHGIAPKFIKYYIEDNGKCLSFLMEYLEGYDDAFDWAAERSDNTPLSKKISHKVCINIATLLQKTHALGLIHNDLKLENILINPQTLNVKLIDMGFVTMKQSDKLVGTLDYICPLKSRKIMYSYGTDCWAMGCIAVMLMFNYEPKYLFKCENMTSLRSTILTQISKHSREHYAPSVDKLNFNIITILDYILPFFEKGYKKVGKKAIVKPIAKFKMLRFNH